MYYTIAVRMRREKKKRTDIGSIVEVTYRYALSRISKISQVLYKKKVNSYTSVPRTPYSIQLGTWVHCSNSKYTVAQAGATWGGFLSGP